MRFPSGSIAVDDLPVVPDREPVEDGHVGRALQGRHVPVGEGEQADAGVVAAELAMPRAVQVVGSLAQVEFREASDPVIVAGEVAVVDGVDPTVTLVANSILYSRGRL